MAFSQDSDLVALVPDILDFGITSFATEHAKAQTDLTRTIRNEWWYKKQIPLSPNLQTGYRTTDS